MTSMIDMGLTFVRAQQDLMRLTVQAAETWAAAGRVVERRSGVIGAAARDPLSADLAELNLMMTEKAPAFLAAGTAFWSGWLALQQDAARQMGDIGRIAGWMADPSPWRASARIADRGARMTKRAGAVGGRALAPVHRAATANDRRLAK